MTNIALTKNCRTKYRGTKGSIAFGVVLAFILVILGVGFMAMMLYMGGQNETKNAVDAGALNIGKQIVDKVNTNLSLIKEEERLYYDVTTADTYRKLPKFEEVPVTLRKINRAWAKALLIGINADAANQDGQAGSGLENAKKAIQGAEGLSDDLQKEILKTDKWRGWFDEIAKQNSVRMIGKDASMVPLNSPQWQSSCMMRGAESNIQLSGEPPFNLPPHYTLNADYYTNSTRDPKPPGSEGRYFLKGYTPIQVAGQTVWQIPFPYDEKTHLVSGPKFEAEKPSAQPLSWKKPIPNAFSASGDVVRAGGGLGEHASSWVIANPHEPFRMAIPHSFLKIHVEKPKTHWKFLPYVTWVRSPYGDQEYDFDGPTDQTGPLMPLGGVGCSTSFAGVVSNIGLDVFGRPLDWLLFPPEFNLGDNDTKLVEDYMVNRVNEMMTDVNAKPLTADDLHKCLVDPLTIGYLHKWQDLYIFSTDGKTITCAPKEVAMFMAPWLLWENNMIDNEPDGTEKKIIDDNWIPGVATGNPTSTPLPPIPKPWVHVIDTDWCTYDENVYWTPGSGYNGCLGTIRLERFTEVFTLSIWI